MILRTAPIRGRVGGIRGRFNRLDGGAILASLLVFVLLAAACGAGDRGSPAAVGASENSTVSGNGSGGAALDASAAPIVEVSQIERIGTGRGVAAATNGITTVVATTVVVEVLGPSGTMTLPVSTLAPAEEVAISSDGAAAIIRWPDSTEVWSLADPAEVLHVVPNAIAAGFAGSGTAVVTTPDVLQVIDTADGSVVDEVDAPTDTSFRSLVGAGDDSLWLALASTDDSGGDDDPDEGTATPAEPLVLVGNGSDIAPIGLTEGFVVERAALDPSGRHLAIQGVDVVEGADAQLVGWDVATRRPTWTVPMSGDEVWDIGADGTVLIGTPKNFRLVGASGVETSVRVDPGGGQPETAQPLAVHGLASGSFVTIWQNGSRTIHDGDGSVRGRDDGTGNRVVASTTADDRSVVIAIDADGSVQVLDGDGQLDRQVDDYRAPAVNDVALRGTGELALARVSGQVTLIEPGADGSAAPIEFLHPEGAVDAVAFSPRGDQLVTGVAERRGPYSFDDTVSVWDAQSAERLQALGGESEDVGGCLRFGNFVRFAPDGSFLVAASHDFTLNILDGETYEITGTVFPQGGPLRDAAISHDGTRLATTSDDSTLRLWDLSNGELLARHLGPIGGYFSLEFLPDGGLLVVDTEGGLSVIDAMTGETTTTFESAASRDSNPALSADGRLVAAGRDGFLRLWSVADGQVVGEFEAHSGLITSTAFSDDGSTVVSAATDGTAVLWDLEITEG